MKLIFLFIFILNNFNYVYSKGVKIDPDKCKIWGPGLYPDKIVMPARYFYIQTYDKNGKKVISKPSGKMNVDITGHAKIGECRVWTQTLYRHDGSYIVRYKVYNTCYNLKIDITYKNKTIAKSPIEIAGPVHAENCYCPEDKFSKWYSGYGCDKMEYPQLQKDLELFPQINFSEFRSATLKRFDRPGSMSFCNYVIKNNEIHRKCYGEHVGFKMFWDNILLSLSRKVKLPNVEFFVNLGDWPLVFLDKEYKEIKTAMLSWCGSDETADIIVPTYDITEASLECMGRVSLDMLSVQKKSGKPWEERENKAFWRGRDSTVQRLELIDIARENPELINASLTNFFFFRDKEEKYGPKAPYVSFFDFFNYKYEINMDGTVAAYRFPYLLAGGSLIFKQDSKYYEHFYTQVKPWEHYVPFKHDLSDLVEQIKWALEHDKEAEKIAKQARRYAKENLAPQNIFCYHAALFKEWNKRLVSKVKIRKEMERVPQPDVDVKYGTCNCDQNNIKDEL